MRHADHHLVKAVLGALVDRGVHHRDHAFGAFQREPLLPNVFGLQEGFEGLGRVQLAQDVFLLGHSRFDVLGLDPFFQPALLFGVEDVGVLHADVAAVGVPQQAENVAQLLVFATGEAVDLEHPVQVPQRQAVVEYVEIGVAAEPGAVQPQRVDVGHQVTAVAVGRDQLHHPGVLVDDRVRVVGAPAHGQVRVAQLAEDLVPEAVRQQHLVDGAQEIPGFRALDDAVVVGRGQGDQLADTQLGDALRAGALELRRVFHRAHADDGALAGHQPRHRVHGADGAGVGQRNRHAGKVFGGQLAVARPPDDVFVGGDELGEPQLLAALDAGHHQGALAVFALQVDGQAEIGVRRRDRGGLAVDLGVVPVHVRELLDRLHQRITQQVGEGDLAAAGALELVVDHDPVVDQQLGRNGAHTGRRRHVQRRGHVLDDGRGGAAQHLHLVAFGRRGSGGLRCGRGRSRRARRTVSRRCGFGGRGGRGGRGRLPVGWRRCRGRFRGCFESRFGVVVDQELMPARIDRRGVVAELAVHLLDQPFVLPEW